MQFNLYATFRLLAGVKVLHLDLPEGTTVKEAVDAVICQVPALRPHWLSDDGELHAHVHIFVDGEDVQNMAEGIHTALKQNAVLDFFPPVGGG